MGIFVSIIIKNIYMTETLISYMRIYSLRNMNSDSGAMLFKSLKKSESTKII